MERKGDLEKLADGYTEPKKDEEYIEDAIAAELDAIKAWQAGEEKSGCHELREVEKQTNSEGVEVDVVTVPFLGEIPEATPDQKEEKRRDYNLIRDEKEKDLRGGFELIYPLSDFPADAERRKLYQSFLSSAQDQYEFFNSHKRICN